jgi:hypothetical protein
VNDRRFFGEIGPTPSALTQDFFPKTPAKIHRGMRAPPMNYLRRIFTIFLISQVEIYFRRG